MIPMPADEALLRVPARLVADSEGILHALGLSTDEAVRLFLTQVSLRRGLPFAVALPPESRDATNDDDDLLAPAAVRQANLDSLYDDADTPLA